MDLIFVLVAGVAYSRNLVHLYSYNGGDDLRNHLEVGLVVILIEVFRSVAFFIISTYGLFLLTC